jgi:hypothetical protein
VERHDTQAGLRIHFVRVRGLVTPIDHVHLFVGLRAGHACFHPAEKSKKSSAAFDDHRRKPFLLEYARQPDMGLGEGKLQGGGHDTDNGERGAVQRDRLPENVLVAAETVLPEG